MRVDRVWICNGCKAPRSDWSPPAVKAALIGAGALAFIGYGWLHPGKPASASNTQVEASGPANVEPFAEATSVEAPDTQPVAAADSPGEQAAADQPTTEDTAATANDSMPAAEQPQGSLIERLRAKNRGDAGTEPPPPPAGEEGEE